MLKPRKRLVKAKLKEDKLLIFTARVRNLASRYQRQLLYGLAAVVVILVVGIAMSLSKTAAERNAAFEMLLARDAYAMGDLDKTLVHTKTVLEDYTGTRAAAEALMLEARVSEQGGDYEKAIELY